MGEAILLSGRRVLIGTPAYSWSADIRYVHSLGQTIKLCGEQGVDVRWLFPPEKIITQARNELVRDALKYGFDDLVFIDADQNWKAEDFIKLLSYDVDCVGAPIRKKTDDRELFNVHTAGGVGGFQKHPHSDLLTTPDMALGTGFIRFSRRALQALWDASEKYSVVGDEGGAWIFDYRPQGGVLVGEDILVSRKLKELGIDTWIDPAMTCGHVGQKSWEGNFGEWLTRMQRETSSNVSA